MSKLEHALALAAKGFAVFPIKAGAKSPPLIKAWPERATADEAAIRDWWFAWPNANIGVHCNNLAVIDVDVKKGGDESYAKLDMVYGFPPTLTTHTPTGGRHLFYRLPGGDAVANSVGALAPGLDVRSTNGYVLGPGSITVAGTYTSDDVLVADAPEWLILKLGTIVPRSGTKSDNAQDIGPDAPIGVIDRAAEWLKTAERSVKGDGGDQAAYRVACALRDFGVSYGQACELMRSEAWDHGCGWRGGWLEDKPIRSAYRYATGEPGSRIAIAEDFPAVAAPPVAGESKSVILTLAEFAGQAARGAGYAVKGLLQRGSYAEAYGAPGEGKTFVMLDLAYHVAAGRPWMDRKVHGGPVLYLAYEGTGGLVKRAQAIRQKYGQDDVMLYVAGAAMDLRAKPGRRELGGLLDALPSPPVLIVIDTFARALCGGDENSAQDVGAFNSAVGALIDRTGACVCIVHHTGKDKSRGARGSSALLGALDTEIEVSAGQVIARKQRDIEAGDPIGFKLVPVLVGIDADGDDITSCVVEPAAADQVHGLPRLGGNAKRGFEALCEAKPNNDPITQREWRDKCEEFLGGRAIAQRFYDIKKTLLRTGHVVQDDEGRITRRME